LADQVRLPDDLGDRARAHPLGERRALRIAIVSVVEEVHRADENLAVGPRARSQTFSRRGASKPASPTLREVTMRNLLEMIYEYQLLRSKERNLSIALEDGERVRLIGL